jgi:hypothetical protein
LDPDSTKYLFSGFSEPGSETPTKAFFARRILSRPLYNMAVKLKKTDFCRKKPGLGYLEPASNLLIGD